MKDKGLNKYFLIIFSITLIVLLGISSILTVKVKDVDLNEIMSNIESNCDFSKLNLGSSKDLKRTYGINPDDIEDFRIYTPISNMNADELLLIRVKNADDTEAIEKKIEEITEKQGNSFKDYAPDQYALIESKLLYSKGKYFILFVGKDVENASKAFKQCFR
ncbi:DUF4358 domain-containing protein [Clostridium frigidicarnis]|uniref:DUF4358 domain-containing protein n=1 Tax=Clostridium frigidicarnis TaxID=84698 RepID=A0A1I0XIS0_9CLOT|nr:DUF4358 domain-containing protein [Clostridium frigidicarnis]SFB00108.1 protein of unknown function [Clostridium frigidicarnis]